MRNRNIIIALLLVTPFVFGQKKGIIFPSSNREVYFHAKKHYLHFDEGDSLDLTPKFYFRISTKPLSLKNKNYYKMYFGQDSTADCFGYVRQLGNKISIIPVDSEKVYGNEKVLFDFDAKVGSSWTIYPLYVFSTNKMKLVKKHFNKKYGEYLYDFETTTSPTKTVLERMTVGKKNGIIKVVYLYHYGFRLTCYRNK